MILAESKNRPSDQDVLWVAGAVGGIELLASARATRPAEPALAKRSVKTDRYLVVYR